MNLTVNGAHRCVDEPCSVSDLLERYRLDGKACAVEVNRRLVPKGDHEQHRLREGDCVEVVTLVGGG